MRLTMAVAPVALAALLCAGDAEARDRDNNPPGPRGGPGASPERFGRCR